MADQKKEPRFGQIREAYRVTKEAKPWIGIALLAIVIGGIAIGVLIGTLTKHPIYVGFISMPLAVLVATYFFSIQANRAAYASIEGVAGAGASVLMAIRRGVVTTPMVAVNKNQDMVHRATSKAGVILIGEGGNAVRSLLNDEEKKCERFVPGIPVTQILVGEGEGRVDIRKLQRKVKRLPKKISTAQLREIRNRLKAVGGFNMPIPKGPMPKSFKVPKR